MSFLHRLISRTKPPLLTKHLISPSPSPSPSLIIKPRYFSTDPPNNPPTNTDELWTNKPTDDQPFNWATSTPPPPPTQIAAHFDGQTPEAQAEAQSKWEQEWKAHINEANKEMRWARNYMESWEDKVYEVECLMEQVIEPGFRGDLLLDAEKVEMYKKYKEDPVVNSVEKLAKEYRIMRQRVHAILWLKEMEEEEERKRGEPLDDSVEALIDAVPEFFQNHDREFHVASLPYKPDFRVMPEGWDGTTRDPDEVHYEISKKEDDQLYEEFLQRFNFNKMKFKGEVKVHKYSRRRPSDGWNFTVEKLGARGKRGGGGGWKFVSQPDGSTRPLNETEKLYVKREAPRRRRKILP